MQIMTSLAKDKTSSENVSFYQCLYHVSVERLKTPLANKNLNTFERWRWFGHMAFTSLTGV
jgi:hypothetical protein